MPAKTKTKAKRIKKFQKGKGPLFSLLPLLALTIFTAVIATQVSNQRFDLRKKAQGNVEIGLSRIEEGESSPIQRLLNLLFPKRLSLSLQLSQEDKELLQLGYPIPRIVIKQEGRVLKVDPETSRVIIKKDLPLELDASSSRGEIKGYTWTFGDFSKLQEGTNLTRIDHTYTQEGSYFLSLSLTTEDILKTNSIGLTIQVGTSKESQLIQSYNFEKYYRDNPDQRPPQLTQQDLTKMKEDFERLLQEKKQQRELSSQSLTTERDTIAIVVDRYTYDDLEVNGINLLEQYIQDVEANFPEVDLILKKEHFSDMTGEQVRGRLRHYWENDDIDGAVLVGLIPYMVWKQQKYSDTRDQRGPCNLCFEDLDGRFYDTDSDGVYDTHFWNTLGDNIEIWVAWMRPPVSGATEYLREFLQKTHRYYEEPEPKGYRKEALFYAEEAGERGLLNVATPVRNNFLALPGGYGERNVVDYGSHFEAKLLSDTGFLDEISRSPEFTFFAVHGSAGTFNFHPAPLWAQIIRDAAGGSLITWGYSCGIADFYSFPSDNVLQACVFDSLGAQEEYNQAAVGIPFNHNWGVTLPLFGGGFEEFFSTFFSGKYLGGAWFAKEIKDATHSKSYFAPSQNNISGFMLVGNPFVRHRNPPSYPNPRPQIREILRQPGSSNITILGSNFGSEQGQVLADGFEAEVRGWHDGGISAVLPDSQRSLSSHIRVWTPRGGNSESFEFNYHKTCYDGVRFGVGCCYGYPVAGTDICQTTGLDCNDPCQGQTGSSSVSNYLSQVSLSSSQCRDCTVSGWVGCGQPLSYTNTFPVVLKYQGVELARAYPPTTQGQGSYELYHPLDPGRTYTLELGDLPQGVTSDVHTITGAPLSAQYNFYLDSCDLTPSPPDNPPAGGCPDGSVCREVDIDGRTTCVGNWECGNHYYCETSPQWCSNDNDLSNGYCCPDPNDPPPIEPPGDPTCIGDETIFFWLAGPGVEELPNAPDYLKDEGDPYKLDWVIAVNSENGHPYVRLSKFPGGTNQPVFLNHFGDLDDPWMNPLQRKHTWIFRLRDPGLNEKSFSFFTNCPDTTSIGQCPNQNICVTRSFPSPICADTDFNDPYTLGSTTYQSIVSTTPKVEIQSQLGRDVCLNENTLQETYCDYSSSIPRYATRQVTCSCDQGGCW